VVAGGSEGEAPRVGSGDGEAEREGEVWTLVVVEVWVDVWEDARDETVNTTPRRSASVLLVSADANRNLRWSSGSSQYSDGRPCCVCVCVCLCVCVCVCDSDRE
jgi:hypothetical protein